MRDYYIYKMELKKNNPEFLICFYSGRFFNYDYFLDVVSEFFENNIFCKNILFLTLDVNSEDVNSKIFNSDAQKKLKDRINSFQEISFHTCFFEARGAFKVYTFGKDNSDLSASDIESALDFGLFNLLVNRDLIIEAHSNIHFVKPSGKHTTKFLDVKNILESSSETIFIAINLLKLIPEKVDKIYVDTAGIYPLAYELSNILRTFGDGENDIAIDSFGSYGGIDEYNFQSDSKTLVLISASTSNGLLNKLRANVNLMQASYVSLIMTQVNNDGHKVLIEFKKFRDRYNSSYFDYFDSYDESDCKMCHHEYSIPIPLNKSKFIFETPRTEKYLPVAADSDKNLKGLISRYKNTRSFKCLYDGVDGSKNPTPEFFVDVEEIIKQKSFKIKLASLVKRNFPLNTDCILHCNDSGAKELADEIYNVVDGLGLSIKVFRGKLDEGYKPTKGIVVVAGSIESGKSLLNISRQLRDHSDIPITYIVGFSKYNSEKEFNKLQMDLKFSEGPCGFHHFFSVEKILLPINEFREHSWSKEVEFLKELKAMYSDKEHLSKAIDKRMDFLVSSSSSESRGMGDQIFIDSPTGEPLVLGPTFAFWDSADNRSKFTHQATVYFTIASVLQRLRTVSKNGATPLGNGYIIKQLDPLLFDRFNEGIIQASIIRAAKPRELDYSADDSSSRLLGSLIERMIKNPALNDSKGLPEILLALCLKKIQIKKNYLSDFNDLIIDDSEYPMVWMLKDYIKRKIVLMETDEPVLF